MYKKNLHKNRFKLDWLTRIKYLKSMQKLKNMKFKIYFNLLENRKFIQQIINGGWHFSFMQII